MALTRSAARTLCAANAQVGLRTSDPRLDAQIDQAMSRLVRHRNAFVAREEYSANPITFVSASDPLQLDEPDALKHMVLAIWREENNELEMAGTLEAKAYAYLEKDIAQAFESANKVAYVTIVDGTQFTREWYAARLALDTAGGLSTSQTKLLRFVRRASEWIYQKKWEHELLERNRVHDGAPTKSQQPNRDDSVYNPPIDYETMRLVCQAFALEGNSVAGETNPQQLAQQYFTEALALLHRKMDAELEELRHGTYTTYLNSLPSNTFGATVAQLALELPMGLKLSMTELKRLVNSAERRLVECGKWKNAIADFEIEISESGEVDMPAQVETVLGATLCNAPTLIKGIWYEVNESGPGRVNDLCGPRGLLVDRGEHTVDDERRRRYWVGVCNGNEQTLIVRAKRRFTPHYATGALMMIRNYSAIRASAQALIHEGGYGIEQRDPGLAKFYWNQALQILADELVEHVGDSATPSMPVQGMGFSPASMDYVL